MKQKKISISFWYMFENAYICKNNDITRKRMSHFAVMVIGDDVEAQLEKYDENIKVEEYCEGEVSTEDKEMMIGWYLNKKGETFNSFEECYEKYGNEWNGGTWRKDESGVWKMYTTYNPISKWDWYQIGGRFSGEFITHLKKDAKITSENYGEMSWMSTKQGIDTIQKKYIDFDAIRKEEEDKAREHYREVAALFENNIIPKVEMTWKYIHETFQGKTLDEKRKIYNSQTAVKLWNAAVEKDKLQSPRVISSFFASIDDYQMNEEEYVKFAGDSAFVPFAVVKDGEWYERGKMGWFAAVSDEKDKNVWNETVKKLLDETGDDELITFVDCHI